MTQKNTFRLSVQYVGFGDGRRPQYKVHINCPCNLKKSLWGTYATEQECRNEVPTSRPAYTCVKSTPVIPEKTVAPTFGRLVRHNSKTRFIKEVADLIRGEGGADDPQPVFQSRTISTGHLVTIERGTGDTHKALIIKTEKGDFFEFRCAFSAQNAGEISTQVWNLMRTMMG